MAKTVPGAICSNAEFSENLKINFTSLIRKKGSIDYLPWAEIVRTLHKQVSGCTYGFFDSPDGSVIHYTPTKNAYLRPYLTRFFPEQDLIITSPPGFFPISNMAVRHKAIEDPDIRAIDNCLRRAIAKEIGVHTGIGLSLWAASDPFDEIDDEAANFSGKPGAAQARAGLVQLARAAESPVATPSLGETASKAGLSEHGRKTIFKALSVESWNEVTADKQRKVFDVLSNPDNIKLFNAGKNTKGVTILPMSKEEEMADLAAAFKKPTT